VIETDFYKLQAEGARHFRQFNWCLPLSDAWLKQLPLKQNGEPNILNPYLLHRLHQMGIDFDPTQMSIQTLNQSLQEDIHPDKPQQS
jgi:hypothetical protein